MPRNVVVLLNSEDGRALVKKKCRAKGIRISVFEALIAAELEQVGKAKKRGIRLEFDRILDEAAAEETG